MRAAAASAVAACWAALASSCSNEPPPTAPDGPLTLDTHIDIPIDYATAATDPLTADLQVNLTKMEAGGLDAGFFIVFVGQTERTADGYARAHADAETKFAAIHRMTEQLYPERIEIAYTANDVSRIASAGKLVAAIGIENGYSLGPNLELLDRYHELGARYVGLVHDGDNDLARSARPSAALADPAASTAGVTALGAEAIARLNRLGIMVDVSHGAKQTALDAMRLSVAPVIASHSGIASVNAHPRNMDDETLLALKADGGVVQVVAYDSYLKQQPEEKTAAMRALRQSVGLTGGARLGSLPAEQRTIYDERLREIEARWPAATVADLVDHIDYAVELIGVDHVGIASDFDGGGGITGWADAAETRNVTAELEARGYSREETAKILSGNLLRVWREAERTAAELSAERD
ncbi:MAG: membrane dipeptidase [Lysobacterales bacterium]|nr:MAG: membrane dipeptidase [Xanthomonadales bacterium]